jgi:hypothetical protein
VEQGLLPVEKTDSSLTLANGPDFEVDPVFTMDKGFTGISNLG